MLCIYIIGKLLFIVNIDNFYICVIAYLLTMENKLLLNYVQKFIVI